VSDSIVLRADGVSKKFTTGMRRALYYAAADIAGEIAWWRKADAKVRPGEFWAVENVSLELERGQGIGIIGANGAGKSTLLKLLSGLLKPDAGSVLVRGRLRAMIELGAAFTPSLTGLENIHAQASLYGYHRKELAAKLDSIVDFAGIGAFIDAPVQQFSDGMRARLGFAVAVHLDPDILLVDEVLAVGDMAFQHKCLAYIREYLAKGGALVFVGHGSHQIQAVCDRGLVLASGRTVFTGSTVDALDFYIRMQHKTKNRPDRSPDAVASSGHVGIEQVDVEAFGGPALRSYGTLRISVRYRAEVRLQNVELGFMIYSSETGACLGGGVPRSTVTLESGAHWLKCLVPDLPLLPGEYFIRIHLYDKTIDYPLSTSGWDDAPHRFVVDGDASAPVNLSRLAGMYVAFPTVWED
jgi:lipopolysaccharide transport system ATP-binding protein